MHEDLIQRLRAAGNNLVVVGHTKRALCAEAAGALEAVQAQLRAAIAERDMARAKADRTVKLLVGIHSLLYPPHFTHEGKTFAFRPNSLDQHVYIQALSDRIRAIPDELDTIAAASAPSR